MTNMEDSIWFAVAVITELAFDTNNTVADTAEKLGVESIAEIIEFRAAMPAHFNDDYQLAISTAASYPIDFGVYEYDDLNELSIMTDSATVLKRVRSLTDPIDELAEELYDILLTGRYKEAEKRPRIELTREMYRSRFFNTVQDYAYTEGYNQYMTEHIADIPRRMPCFAVWSEKVERDARAYAENYAHGWATGACEAAIELARLGIDMEKYSVGEKQVDADIVREFVALVKKTADRVDESNQ